MELYKHQRQVLEQIKNKNKCALYLDMGLGKTFVASEKMIELDEKLTIIVCPKSVVDTWENHIKIYYPEYQVFKYKLPEELPNKTVIIINYDLIWRRQEFKKLKEVLDLQVGDIVRLDRAADDTILVSVDGRERYIATIGLQRYRKTLQIQEVIKTEKDQVKEILEMLEIQRKSRANEIEDD